MLSLRGARRLGAGSRGGLVADDAEVLEEGEACSDSDDFFDPDVALSYIDEKLQHVLGHFQKEFEGGVSAENLGPTFGGYGSFLPTYQHSSLLPQSRSPHIAANIGTSRSPYQPSAERMDQNPSTVALESISRNNGSGAPSTGYLQKKERFSSTNNEESVGGSDSVDSLFNGGDSKSLKVWTKVCSKKYLPRNKSATYSGMGLDISSSSSMEESPDSPGGLSPEFSNVPYESPRTILQVMTSFPVPGGFLLSPLCGSFLQLTNKVTPMLKNLETPLGMDNVPRDLEERSQSPRPPGPVRGHVDKQTELIHSKKVPLDAKNRKDKCGTSGIVNNEVNIQMHVSQEIISDTPAPRAAIKRDDQFAQKTTIDKYIFNPSQQNDNVRPKDQIGGDDLTGMLTPKRGIKESDMSHHRPSSFNRKRKDKLKSEEYEAAIADCDYNDSRMKEWAVGPCDDLRNTPLRALSSNRTGDGHPRTEFQRMHEECLGSAPASYDLMEDDNYTRSSAADMVRENSTELISCHFEKKAKSHNNLSETLPNKCRGDIESGLLEDNSAQGELHQKKKMNTNNENESDVGSVNKEIPISVKHGQLCILSTSGVCMSKIKNKRGINQDEQEPCKKTKIEEWRQMDRGRGHECDSDGAEVPYESQALLAKVKTMKGSHEIGGIYSHKENGALGYDLLENLKSIDAMDVPFNHEKKEGPSDVDMLDLSCKKNVLKEWEENQINSMHCVSNRSEKQNLKEKKSKTLKSEEMVSKADSKPQKVQHVDAVLSSGGRLNYELGAGNMFVTGKGLSEQQETLPPQQVLDLAEPPGRDVAYLKSSTAATSSSYRISSSIRNNNLQEAKDSPVKSVSSSSLRIFNIKNISHDRKDGSVDGFLGNTHNIVRHQNTGVSALNSGQKVGKFERYWGAGETNFHGSLKGISDRNIMKIHQSVCAQVSCKKIRQSACAQVSDVTNLNRSLDNSLPKTSWRKDLTVSDVGVGRGDHQLCSGDKKSLDMEVPSPEPDQNFFDRSSTTLITESGPSKSHPRIENQDIRNPIPQVRNLPEKESKQKVCPTSAKSDSLKMKRELMRSNVGKGVQNGIVKQDVSNPLDMSTVKKDSSMVALAIKEARNLKHKANDLKNKGQELESTGLYFEAALKFMRVAFLLETPSFDSSRPGDVARSIKMYSETAKLCNFCAYEYERFKKMAAAALAYKCVEVAYLKAAYYKHPSARKDRQELQAAVLIAPGKSPSSYASDVDNLYRHGLSKGSSRKGLNSPQVPGSHLPLSVHKQARLLRLLAYTNDLNLAFEATRKSELVIVSAAGNKERGEGVDDDLASVKTVLDLNFSNVTELVRLVRVSMESICC